MLRAKKLSGSKNTNISNCTKSDSYYMEPKKTDSCKCIPMWLFWYGYNCVCYWTEVFSKPIFSTLSYLSTLKATAFLSLLTVISSSAWFSLKYHRTHQHIFRSMFHFYTPRKHQKATSFFILSRGIEGKHWLDIG